MEIYSPRITGSLVLSGSMYVDGTFIAPMIVGLISSSAQVDYNELIGVSDIIATAGIDASGSIVSVTGSLNVVNTGSYQVLDLDGYRVYKADFVHTNSPSVLDLFQIQSGSAGSLKILSEYSGSSYYEYRWVYSDNNSYLTPVYSNVYSSASISVTFDTGSGIIKSTSNKNTNISSLIDAFGHNIGVLSNESQIESTLLEYLVVAGGGGGGSFGGGGGAGGFRNGIAVIEFNTFYTITVGAGGAGATTSDTGVNGVNGSNSVFDVIASAGGGGGGTRFSSAQSYVGNAGNSGGSGGGGANSNTAYNALGGAGNTPSTSPSQGNNGGVGGAGTGGTPNYSHGGGGGAGSVGDAGKVNSPAGSNGGEGISSQITGTDVYYAGGGGGGVYNNGTIGIGGSGGGGNGGGNYTGAPNATNGEANLGGGGGGGVYSPGPVNTGPGGTGGSGVVIIKFLSTFNVSISAGLTYEEVDNGDPNTTVIKFTAGTGTVTIV